MISSLRDQQRKLQDVQCAGCTQHPPVARHAPLNTEIICSACEDEGLRPIITCNDHESTDEELTACRIVLVAEARRCIYGHQLEGYKQVRPGVASAHVALCCCIAYCTVGDAANSTRGLSAGNQKLAQILRTYTFFNNEHLIIMQAGEDGGLELVGGTKEERQGLTADDDMDGGANGGANGHRFDLADDEDDEELAFATAKFAKD